MLGVWRLQLLREISRRGSIKAAAEAMEITPSAVSQQLAILEREAGVQLLEKSGRRVRLTEAAQRLVRHADAITGAIAAAEADLASMQRAVTGTLRVSAFPTAARAVMPPVMTALSRLHPELRVTLRDLEADESLTALKNDEIDIAIVDDYGDGSRVRDPGLEICEFMRDLIYLATASATTTETKKARASATGAVSPTPTTPPAGEARLEEFRNAFWIMDTDNSHLSRVVLQECRRLGFEPHIRSSCKDFSVIIALVEAGLGVGVLPGLALLDRPVRAQVRPISPPLARRISSVIRPERRSHPMIVSALAELERFGASYVPEFGGVGE
ncbi:MAG: LysR family transcriptional regulator [Candidatus Limnocylindrales bacterium]|jgi:DNA-binding transcriptional LysR family regulator